MPPKTIKKAIKNCLENLTTGNFNKFRDELLDRREEPRIATSRVEGKDFMIVTDVMVTTFGEAKALDVVLELLEEINCQKHADALAEETKELTSKAGSSRSAGSSAGAAGVTPKSDEQHFVDKHKAQLIQKVTTIGPILDQLLAKEVIQQESYDKISLLRPSQEQMRELYRCSLNAAPACKDIFYEILKKEEKYLVEHLKNNE